MTCKDEHVTIKIAATGEQIAAYTMESEKVYYNQKDNEITATRGATKTKSLETPSGTTSRDFTWCPRVDSNHRHRL